MWETQIWPGMKYNPEPHEREEVRRTRASLNRKFSCFLKRGVLEQCHMWLTDGLLFEKKKKKSVKSERHSYEIYRRTWPIHGLQDCASRTATFLHVIWPPEIWLYTHNDNHFPKLWNMEPITKLFLTVMRTAHIIILKLAFNSSRVIISLLKNLYFETTDYISLNPSLNSS